MSLVALPASHHRAGYLKRFQVPATLHLMPGLGRRPAPDQRDDAYPILTLLGAVAPTTALTRRFWGANGWWGNQGNEPQCVGYGWTHWLEDGPFTHPGVAPIVNPAELYRKAQRIDEWPGEGYPGTSVRAGAKVLVEAGYVESYHWAFDLDTTIEALLTKGPVVVGTNWYRGMFSPGPDGILKLTGPVDGGHCYVLNGVNRTRGRVRVKNSWGRSWGRQGFATLTFEGLERLINEGGEVCLAVEKRA